jgi:SAM-dependent methyltransferase
MQQTWFKDWFNSPYYHQLYFNRDDKEAASFIDLLIAHLRPVPGSAMLDVACGKGRHSLLLAEKGFEVTGIDLSDDSITEALRHETDTLHFFLHDMRLPCWINYFDYAFNFFTSFGYFRTRREHDDAIRTIAQAVKPGGTFVLDYLNVHYAEDHLVHQMEKQVDQVNFLITKWYDETHFYKKIIIEDEAMREPMVYTEKVAKFSLGDFTEMFAYQGLQIIEVFGDYNFSRYDVRKSPRLLMIAKKTKA